MTSKNASRQPEADAPDPLIDEVRDVRRRLSERFGNDVDRLADHLKTIEGNWKGRVIKAPERPGEEHSSVA